MLEGERTWRGGIGKRIQFRNVLRARDNLYFTKVVGMQIKATYMLRVSEPILRKPLANTVTNDVKRDRTSMDILQLS